MLFSLKIWHSKLFPDFPPLYDRHYSTRFVQSMQEECCESYYTELVLLVNTGNQDNLVLDHGHCIAWQKRNAYNFSFNRPFDLQCFEKVFFF